LGAYRNDWELQTMRTGYLLSVTAGPAESLKATDTLHHCGRRRIINGLAALVLMLSVPLPAAGQTANVSGIRLEDDVVPAPEGYESVTAKYIAAKPTDIYISPFIWGGKVRNVHLDAGEQVEVLAKPKGYDWLLVGKNGAGIGYVPISALSPARR
jgi:hypothetical protein